MTAEISMFLDFMRFSAACAVVASHLFSPLFTVSDQHGLAGLGVFAVGVFFLLSGFLIEFTISKSAPTLRQYLVARSARIYSVLVPSLILTYCLLGAGLALFPEAYREYGVSGNVLSARNVSRDSLSCLTFLNESPWFAASPPTNGPIWSLGYEVPYYLFFAVITFSRRPIQIFLVVASLFVWGLPVACLFPAWFAGAQLFRLLTRTQVTKGTGMVALTLIPFVVAISMLVNRWWMSLSADQSNGSVVLRAVHIAAGGRSEGFPLLYGGAVSMACLILGVAAFQDHFGGRLLRLTPFTRLAASCTFSLYLFHLPILFFLCANPLYHRHRTENTILAGFATLCLCFVLSRFTETRKVRWHNFFDGVITSFTRIRLAWSWPDL